MSTFYVPFGTGQDLTVKLLFSQIVDFPMELLVKNSNGKSSRSNVKLTLLITKIVKQKSGVHRLVKHRKSSFTTILSLRDYYRSPGPGY